MPVKKFCCDKLVGPPSAPRAVRLPAMRSSDCAVNKEVSRLTICCSCVAVGVCFGALCTVVAFVACVVKSDSRPSHMMAGRKRKLVLGRGLLWRANWVLDVSAQLYGSLLTVTVNSAPAGTA